MAWIQVHQQLKDHRKLLAAADELEIEPPHMLGLLTSFWLWALDNAPSGSLEGISNRNIARAAQWNKEPDAFVEAMKNAGFLDITEDGTLEIHDWYEYAGKLIDQREAEKQRSRRRRAAAAADRRTTAGQPEGQPTDKPENSQQETGGRLHQTTPEQTTPEKESETLDSVMSAGPTPFQQIVDMYHEICKSYPVLRKISANRKKAIAARWKEYGQDLNTFRELFEKAEASPFLKGRNDRNWTADFNWLMNSGNMAKVLEGKYTDNRQQAPVRQQAQPERPGRVNTMDVLAGIIADEEGGGSL